MGVPKHGMHVAEIWRYPVKSMAGERLERAELGAGGVTGDRVVQVYDAAGRVITSRTRPRLLGHRARLGPTGEPLVDGEPWDSAAIADRVRRAAGEGARLARFDGVERFDVLPLLVATDGAVAAFGRDHRRLRPNLVIGGVPGLAERTWQGRVLGAGEVLIELVDLRGRCVMTTYDPDTQEQDVAVLRDIVERFEGTLCLNARVLRPGFLAVGDPVELLAE
jgi:uncharacterized protein YcbX